MTTPTPTKPADPLALLRTRRYLVLLVLAGRTRRSLTAGQSDQPELAGSADRVPAATHA